MKLSINIERIIALTLAKFKQDFSKGYLGFMWWFFEPAAYVVILYFVFQLGLRGSRGVDYVPFLLVGLVVWRWFSSSVIGSCAALTSHKNLIMSINLPKLIFPLVIVTYNSLRFLVIMSIALIILPFLGYPPNLVWLSLPLLLLVQVLLNSSVAMVLAGIVPFASDLKIIISNMIWMMFFLSGVIVDINNFPPELKGYFMLNPMAVMINEFRGMLLHNQWPDFNRLGVIVFASSVLLVIGVFIIKHNDSKYPKLFE